MKCKREIWFILVGSAFILFYLFTRPFLFFVHEDSVLLAIPAPPAEAFSIRFIHSVQKTPVVENLQINEKGDGFMLTSTKYQSFGVGLPFLPSEGNFRQEGDYFVMADMNRKIQQLAVRTGVGTQLTIIYKEVEYPLYQKLVPGQKIELKIAPYYLRFL